MWHKKKTQQTHTNVQALKLEKKNQEAEYIEITLTPKNTQMQIEQNLIQFPKKNMIFFFLIL